MKLIKFDLNILYLNKIGESNNMLKDKNNNNSKNNTNSGNTKDNKNSEKNKNNLKYDKLKYLHIFLIILFIIFVFVFLTFQTESHSLKLTEFSQNKFLYQLKEDVSNNLIRFSDIRDYIIKIYYYPEKNYENANIPFDPEVLKKNGFALVLSGGGARGVAHIGVLKVLEQFNLKPEFVIGTSAGSLVGAMYVQGYDADQIHKIVQDENKNFEKLTSLSNLLPKERTAVLKSIIEKYVKVKDISETKIPFYVNTVDIRQCRQIIFKEGDIVKLVLASSAIPLVFEPIEYKNHILVDGGLYDSFAVDYARKINKEYYNNKLAIVVVDVSAATDISSSVKRSFLLLHLSKEIADHFKYLGKTKLYVKDKDDIFPFLNNILYVLKIRRGLAFDPKSNEYIITPLLENMSVFAFNRLEFAYTMGYRTAAYVLGLTSVYPIPQYKRESPMFKEATEKNNN